MADIKTYPNIKLYRVANGMTQDDVAKELEVNIMTYNKKEGGIREFTGTELIKLTKIFNCSLEDLLINKDIKL